MSDFIFVSDLEIQNAGMKEQTAEGLRLAISEIDAEMNAVSQQILELQKKLRTMEDTKAVAEKKLSDLQEPMAEIELKTPALTKEIPTPEKAGFLLELFSPRRDVYASRRWKDGKTSYFPRCENAWSGSCLLKRFRDSGNKGPKPDCSSCPARSYAELTDAIIARNQLRNSDLHGRDAIGIYPMLPGNVCRFAAIDLDEASWKNDALIVADIARKSGFQMAIEISFSGNGAHLWLFFSEEIPAAKARKLLFSFLDEACRRSKTMSLKSYDRVFPTQDSIEKGGLGNLILMPLVMSAAIRKDNPGTVFVNNSFEMYKDQIMFLSSLPRYSNEDIDLYLTRIQAREIADVLEVPGDVKTNPDVFGSRKLRVVSDKDCAVSPLPVYLSAGISIPKVAMTAKLQDAFKRFACFRNPEYYKYRNTHQGYVSPDLDSFVQSFVESDSVLQLPRGLLDSFVGYLKTSGITYELHDMRKQGTGLKALFKGELKSEQVPAMEAMKDKDLGILRAATSFGKTVLAAKLISLRGERTLILVEKKNLMDQWHSKLVEFLEIGNGVEKREGKRLNKSGIGMYGGSKDSLTGLVDVAMIQSVAARSPEFVRDYGMVIVDECHHVAARTVLQVLQTVRPRIVYGLSATVERDDGLDNLIYAQCGPVVFDYEPSRLAYIRGIRQVFVPRFTNTVVPVSRGRNFNHMDVVRKVSEDDARNELIVNDVLDLVNNGRKVLILTHLVDHTDKLAELLEKKGVCSIVVNGRQSSSSRKDAFEAITNNAGGGSVLISTGKFAGEGTDIPYLDTLVMATPVSWQGVVSQYAGRIARAYEGKREVCIYDYVDICIPQFAAMYTKRLSTYRKLGYVLKDQDGMSVSEGLFPGRSLYCQDDIFDALCNSFRCARKSIFISSPYLFLSPSTRKLLELLSDAESRGVDVSIVTLMEQTSDRKVFQADAIREIELAGLRVRTDPDCFLHHAVMDSNEVWFGDMNILGGAIRVRGGQTSEEKQKVMLHGFSREIAESLMDLDGGFVLR